MGALQSLLDLYAQHIAGSVIWSAIGFGAVCVVLIGVLGGLVLILGRSVKALMRRFRKTALDSFGHSIAVADLMGRRQKAQSQALREALKTHLGTYTFGAPFTVHAAPSPRASKHHDRIETAHTWMKTAGADLLSWGQIDSARAAIDLKITKAGSAKTAEALAPTLLSLPLIEDDSPEIVKAVTAYLYARVLLPGLASAKAFRTDKMEPVAVILSEALEQADQFPPETALVLETDYCAMALHIGGLALLERVAMLRHARLSSDEAMDLKTRIAARVDLGRALLGISEVKYDPARVREAMDHLKMALDMLRDESAIKLATDTTDAVRKGQEMLAARRRFSVTGGSGI